MRKLLLRPPSCAPKLPQVERHDLEFNKIKIEQNGEGNVTYGVKLEVIVPETPVDS